MRWQKLAFLEYRARWSTRGQILFDKELGPGHFILFLFSIFSAYYVNSYYHKARWVSLSVFSLFPRWFILLSSSALSSHFSCALSAFSWFAQGLSPSGVLCEFFRPSFHSRYPSIFVFYYCLYYIRFLYNFGGYLFTILSVRFPCSCREL